MSKSKKRQSPSVNSKNNKQNKQNPPSKKAKRQPMTKSNTVTTPLSFTPDSISTEISITDQLVGASPLGITVNKERKCICFYCGKGIIIVGSNESSYI